MRKFIDAIANKATPKATGKATTVTGYCKNGGCPPHLASWIPLSGSSNRKDCC